MSSSRSGVTISSGQSDSDVENDDLKTNILRMLAERETTRSGEHNLQILQRDKDSLAGEVAALRERLNDAEARAQDAFHSHDIVKELMAMLATERKKMERLMQEHKATIQEKDQLFDNLAACAEAAKTSTEEIVRLQATIESRECGIEDLQQKLIVTETARDWYACL